MPTQDEYQARIRAMMGGQTAPASAHGGVRLLYRCPMCGRAWLMDGAQERLRLDESELGQLAQELGADLGALAYATCRLCGGVHGIGEINLDEYGRGLGYGLSWEGSEPTRAHLLGVAIRLDHLRRSPGASAGVVTDFSTCRAWLAWLARLDAPAMYHPIDAADSAAMATTNRPGFGAPGTDDWQWRGAIWQASVPALGGRRYISLAQAMPAGETFSQAAMFAIWRAIARLVQAGHIAGESGEQGEE